MKWLSHDENLFPTEGFLKVRGPSIELVFGVWKEYAIIFCFGLLDDLEELSCNL